MLATYRMDISVWEGWLVRSGQSLECEDDEMLVQRKGDYERNVDVWLWASKRWHFFIAVEISKVVIMFKN
jgi:hypothetical protein